MHHLEKFQQSRDTAEQPSLKDPQVRSPKPQGLPMHYFGIELSVHWNKPKSIATRRQLDSRHSHAGSETLVNHSLSTIGC